MGEMPKCTVAISSFGISVENVKNYNNYVCVCVLHKITTLYDRYIPFDANNK